MNRIYLITSAVVALSLLVFTQSARAVTTLPSETWVSNTGSDANSCSLALPCGSFGGAIQKTAAGGQINVLNSGDYGAISINKGITIDGGGAMAMIQAASPNTDAIGVVAASNEQVVLRHLTISGGPRSFNSYGIQFNSAAQLVIDDCKIDGCLIGVDGHGGSNLVIKNTTITPVPAGTGVEIVIGGNYSLRAVSIQGGTNGIYASAGTVDVTNSVVTENSGVGVTSTSGATVTLDGCVISHNQTGLVVDANSKLRLANDDLLDNGAGIAINGGSVVTYRNNRSGAGTAPLPLDGTF